MKLYRKLLLVFLPLGIASTAAIAVYSYLVVGRVLVDDLAGDAVKSAETHLSRLAPGIRERSERRLLPELERCVDAVGARYAAVISPDGDVLAHTDVSRKGERALDAFTSHALVSDRPSTRRLEAGGEPLLELSLAIPDEAVDPERYVLEGARPRGRVLGLLRLGLPLRGLLATQKQLATAVVAVAGGTVLITLVIVFLGTRWVLITPLAALSDAVERLRRGQYGAKTPQLADDEIGDLARCLNQMSEELARTTVSKDQLMQILERSIDGVLLVDAQGRINAHNSRFAELWEIPDGILREGFDEKALEFAFRKLKDPEAFIARVRHLYSHREETSRDEVELTDGRTLDRYSAPIFDANGYRGRVWYFRDVTDRKRAEEAEVLRERERVQRDFIASISHDLRTPITAIKGFAETLLAGGLSDREEGAGFVRTIERNADRLAQLVDNVLTISVLESGKRRMHPEPVALEPFIGDLTAALDPLLQRSGLAMRLEVEPELRVMADNQQLSQILQNLIDNAVKFSSWGGMIEIEARRDDGRALVRVSDRGCGVPEKDLAKIFERFHRGDGEAARKTKGSGLGLSIVKQLVELHGGQVWAESPKGRGTTIRFTLPLA